MEAFVDTPSGKVEEGERGREKGGRARTFFAYTYSLIKIRRHRHWWNYRGYSFDYLALSHGLSEKRKLRRRTLSGIAIYENLSKVLENILNFTCLLQQIVESVHEGSREKNKKLGRGVMLQQHKLILDYKLLNSMSMHVDENKSNIEQLDWKQWLLTAAAEARARMSVGVRGGGRTKARERKFELSRNSAPITD
ncbi:CUGBP Elav-like family member 2 isoform X15, partial [Vespula squamosa]